MITITTNLTTNLLSWAYFIVNLMGFIMMATIILRDFKKSEMRSTKSMVALSLFCSIAFANAFLVYGPKVIYSSWMECAARYSSLGG